MFGIFKKWVKDSLTEHSGKFLSVDLRINACMEGINEQIRQNNRQLDYLKQLDRKVDLLAKHFQLEYKGGVFISKRK